MTSEAYAKAAAAYMQATHKGWSFDGFMSGGGWDLETEGHIPDMVLLRDLMALYAANAAGTKGKTLLHWPGPGPTTESFLKRGFPPHSLLATFINDAFLHQHQRSMPSVPCLRLPEPPQAFDMRTHGPFRVVDLTLSLQFELPRQRSSVLAEAHAALEPGGLLLLCEKVRQGEALERFYFDFKRSQGVPEEVIVAKQRALFFKMITLPSRWYLRNLATAGFLQISVLYARAGFLLLSARKAGACSTGRAEPGLAERALPAQTCAPFGQTAAHGGAPVSWHLAMVQLAANCGLGTEGAVLLSGSTPPEAAEAYAAKGWTHVRRATEAWDEESLRPLSVVHATQLLQRRTPEERLRLLYTLLASLEPGGVLLLLESTRAPQEFRELDLAQHACEEDPPTAQWYEEALDEAGFVEVAIAVAWCGRVLWVARRPRETKPSVGQQP